MGMTHARDEQRTPGMFFYNFTAIPAQSLPHTAEGWHASKSSQIRDSIVVSISACHAENPGSIPGRGDYHDVVDGNSDL